MQDENLDWELEDLDKAEKLIELGSDKDVYILANMLYNKRMKELENNDND